MKLYPLKKKKKKKEMKEEKEKMSWTGKKNSRERNHFLGVLDMQTKEKTSAVDICDDEIDGP